MFEDRDDAARKLARELTPYRGGNTVIIGLARGGVVLAYRRARELDAQRGLLVVRKIGAPWNPELAIGAITNGPEPQVFLNEGLIRQLDVSREFVDAAIEKETATLRERHTEYAAHLPELDLADKTVIVTDDGIATGATVKVAVRAIRRRRPAGCILAVPVASPRAVRELEREVDRLVCPHQPEYFQAVGQFYRHFSQVSDAEVVALLERFYGPGQAS